MARGAIKITGSKELQAALNSMSDEIARKVEIATIATGHELRSNIIKGYNEGGKTGITYKKYNPSRIHTASAPGQAPATDTGKLANSVLFEQEHYGVRVFTNVRYGEMLEFGTMRIAPRPLWTPEAQAMKPKFEKRIKAALKDATT